MGVFRRRSRRSNHSQLWQAVIEPLEQRQMLSVTAPLPTTYYIDAGGAAYTDHGAQTWAADKDFSGGGAYFDTAPTTSPDGSLLSHRRTGNFTYSFPIANGTYTVTLLLADSIYATAGQRVFNVTAQGQTVLNHFDIAASGGAGGQEVVRSFAVQVSNGQLTLGFTGILGHATVSGIKIVPAMENPTPTPAPTTPALPSSYLINCGGTAAYKDHDGYTWSADEYFTGGVFSDNFYTVPGTSDGICFYDRRTGSSFNYDLPIANGTYTVQFYFTDPTYSAAGQRKFNVAIGGKTVLSNFDIIASGGGKAPMTKDFTTTVTNNDLHILFTGVVNAATVSGIQVIPQSSATPTPTPAPVPTPTPTPAPTPTPTPTPVPLDFTKISWITAAPSPVDRSEALTAAIGGKLYVFGGFEDLNGPETRSDVYDPATNTWTQIANQPQKLTHVGVATIGTNVYFAGGYVGDPDVQGFAQTYGTVNCYVYSTVTNTYSSLPSLPIPCAAGALVAIGDELHYFGGFNIWGRTDSNLHFVLNLNDLASGWQTASPMPLARNHMAYVNFGNKVYLIAGQTGTDDGLITRSDVQIYDPATAPGAKAPASRSRCHTSPVRPTSSMTASSSSAARPPTASSRIRSLLTPRPRTPGKS